ncbi:MAG TPA: hypothetical protein EYN66_00120 [Myxococcales bacterium]|nr:hypothetical protein [Myxococcales bacterium]
MSSTLQLGMTGCSQPSNCRFLNFRNTNVVRLAINSSPSSTTELLADISLRNLNFTTIESLEDTGDISKVQPVDIRVNEARVTLFDILDVKGLDLNVGALRLAWGTADKVSVLDRLNPYNLEDGSGFDKRLSSPALQLGWQLGSVRIELVALPLFMPAILPVDEIDFTAMGDPQAVLNLTDNAGGDVPPNIQQVETSITKVANTVENIQAAARIKWQAPAGDFSLLFYRGVESLPQASGAVRLTGFQTANRVNLGVPLVYPKVMMAGADFRGPLFDRVSAWAEVAVVFPQAHQLTAAENQLQQLVKLGHLKAVPDPLPVQSTQTDTPFVQGVAGVDINLPGGLYINLQYLRGMATERQANDQHNYALTALRWTLLEGVLVLGANGVLELTPEVVGYQAGGYISWLHGDAAKVVLSTVFMGGKKGATLERFENMSHTRLTVALKF